jgi:hypothetical protein
MASKEYLVLSGCRLISTRSSEETRCLYLFKILKGILRKISSGIPIETANAYLDTSYVKDRDMDIKPGPYAMLMISDTGQGMDEETILLVEDDDDILLRIGRKTLARSGYDVLEAINGEQAIKIAKSHKGNVPLLITDVVMPGVNGREAAEQIQLIRPELLLLRCSFCKLS